MICKKCGQEIPDSSAFCYNCGERMTPPVSEPAPEPVVKQAEAPRYMQKEHVYVTPGYVPPNDGLSYKPISMWGYFGYEILFAIPIIGFILLIVFSCGGTKNVNLRNFARSYFCAFFIALILILIVLIALFVSGGITGISYYLRRF